LLVAALVVHFLPLRVLMEILQAWHLGRNQSPQFLQRAGLLAILLLMVGLVELALTATLTFMVILAVLAHQARLREHLGMVVALLWVAVALVEEPVLVVEELVITTVAVVVVGIMVLKVAPAAVAVALPLNI
jgi:hypothetical protein